jgi:hypothetical protein
MWKEAILAGRRITTNNLLRMADLESRFAALPPKYETGVLPADGDVMLGLTESHLCPYMKGEKLFWTCTSNETEQFYCMRFEVFAAVQFRL